MSEALAAVAAFGYATSDVTTAAIVRRVGPAVIAFWAHVVASVVLLTVAAFVASAPSLQAAALAVGAGLVAGVGAVAYYAALSRGPASVLAPIAAAGVLLPVTVGVAGGDRAAVLAIAGTLLLIGGVTLLSRAADLGGARTPVCAIGLALGSAVAFGAYFVSVDVAVGAPGGHPLWVAGLVTVGSALAALPLALRGGGVVPARGAWRGLVAVGAALSIADLALTAAMAGSDVALVAVIASADPVLTVAAARVVLAERVSRGQLAGIALALTGVLGVAAA